MVEFDVKKLIRLAIAAVVLIFLLRACTASTMGPGYGYGYGGGGGGFLTGIFLGQMMGGDRGGRDRAVRTDKNVRRGSSGKSRSGGSGFGK